MTIKFNKTELFAEAKAKLSAVLSNPESTEAEQTSAYQNYLEVMQNEIVKAVSSKENNEMLDRSILQQRGQNVLTSEETKFFAAVANSGGSRTTQFCRLQHKNACLKIWYKNILY